MANNSIVLQPAYIVDRRQDYVWFVGLPFAAVCFALVSGHYLPGAALAAIALWVTIPHHFVTWLRVYGSPAEFARFKERFLLGPVLLVAFAYGLIQWAPLSLVLIVTSVGSPTQLDAAIRLCARVRLQGQGRFARHR